MKMLEKRKGFLKSV